MRLMHRVPISDYTYFTQEFVSCLPSAPRGPHKSQPPQLGSTPAKVRDSSVCDNLSEDLARDRDSRYRSGATKID